MAEGLQLFARVFFVISFVVGKTLGDNAVDKNKKYDPNGPLVNCSYL